MWHEKKGEPRKETWEHQGLKGRQRKEAHCYGWTFVCPPANPPKLICRIVTPKGDGIGQWGLWRAIRSWARAFMNGTSILIRDPTEISSLFRHVRTLQESICSEPGRGLSLERNHAGTLILNFPASGTVRNEFLLEQPNKLKTQTKEVCEGRPHGPTPGPRQRGYPTGPDAQASILPSWWPSGNLYIQAPYHCKRKRCEWTWAKCITFFVWVRGCFFIPKENLGVSRHMDS